MKIPSIAFPEQQFYDVRLVMQRNPNSKISYELLKGGMSGTFNEGIFGKIQLSLKTIGLVDKTGRLTDLGKRWIDDNCVAGVCREIALRMFPRDMFRLFNDESTTAEIAKWFTRQANIGLESAKKTATFYRFIMRMCRENGFDLAGEADGAIANQERGHDLPSRYSNEAERVIVVPGSLPMEAISAFIELSRKYGCDLRVENA